MMNSPDLSESAQERRKRTNEYREKARNGHPVPIDPRQLTIHDVRSLQVQVNCLRRLVGITYGLLMVALGGFAWMLFNR